MVDDRRRRLLAANQSFYDAFGARDFPAMDRLWARRHPVVCIHPGWLPLVDRQAVIGSWRDIFQHAGGAMVAAQSPRIVMDAPLALVLCFELVGGQLLAATNIFVEEDGAWRMIHHQASGVALEAIPASPGDDLPGALH